MTRKKGGGRGEERESLGKRGNGNVEKSEETGRARRPDSGEVGSGAGFCHLFTGT